MANPTPPATTAAPAEVDWHGRPCDWPPQNSHQPALTTTDRGDYATSMHANRPGPALTPLCGLPFGTQKIPGARAPRHTVLHKSHHPPQQGSRQNTRHTPHQARGDSARPARLAAAHRNTVTASRGGAAAPSYRRASRYRAGSHQQRPRPRARASVRNSNTGRRARAAGQIDRCSRSAASRE